MCEFTPNRPFTDAVSKRRIPLWARWTGGLLCNAVKLAAVTAFVTSELFSDWEATLSPVRLSMNSMW